MEKSPGQSLLLPEKNIRKWMCDSLHKWNHFLYSSPSVSWRCLSLMDKLSIVFSILPLALVTSYALFPKPFYVLKTNGSPLGTATLILLKLPLQDPRIPSLVLFIGVPSPSTALCSDDFHIQKLNLELQILLSTSLGILSPGLLMRTLNLISFV